MERDDRDPRGERAQAAEDRGQRDVAPAQAHVPRHPVRPLAVGLLDAQPHDGDVRHREREHRAERVQVAEQRRLAGEQEQRGEEAEERDREPRRAVLAVQAGEDLGQLAVLGQRP